MKAIYKTIIGVFIAVASLIAPGTASGWTPPSYVQTTTPFFLPAPTANNTTGWQIKNFGPVGIGIKIKSPGWTMEITNVEPGSPAASNGTLAAGQIIQSINGVTLTGVDPRVVLGKIITDAEASDGIISLQIQNLGTKVVNIPVMGSYSATWPLNCPKSDLIVRNLANRLVAQGQNEWGSVLFLLSTGDANDLAVVRGWMQNRGSFADHTWSIGYEGIGVAEYYLRTGDPVVLPLMQEAADKLRDTIYAGGWAGRSGSFTYNSGGHLNAAGVPALTFLLLAKTCGINVDSATLESSLRHFYRFSGTGGVPYGDYTPKPGFSDDNGKTGNLALAMAAASRLTPNGENSVYAQAAQRCATKFFYGMNDYGQGHTGGGIGEIWKSVSMGLMTEKLPAQYRSFMDARWWILELSRRHNGGIGIAGGKESNYDKATGETQNGWGTLYALSYTLPRKHLHLFGAPLSQWAQSFTLPARPWGTAADDAFRSFDPVPGGPWSHQDMLNEVPNLHAGKAVSSLMGSTTSDTDILTYLHHPELTYRNDAIGAILRLGRDSMLSYMINSDDARLQHIGVMALHEVLGTWRTTYKNPSKVTPAMWARIDQLVRDPQTSWFVKQWALGLLQHVDTPTLKTYTSLFVTLADHEEYWLRGQASGNSPRLIADPETYATIFPPVLNAAVDAVPYFEVTGVSALKTGLDAASSEIKNDALQMLMLAYTSLPQELVSERGIHVIPDGGEIKRKSFGQVFGFSEAGQLFVNTRPKKTSAWKVSGNDADLYTWDGNFQTNSAFHGKWKFINSHDKVKDEAAALALIKKQLAANQVPLSTDTSIGFYGFTVGTDGLVYPSGLGNWPNPMRYSGDMVFGTYIDRAYQYKILTVYGRKYLMMEIEFIADADPTIEGGAGPELDPTYQTSYMVYANINTADTIPPEIITLSPADNATGVAVGANLVATFSETIVRGTGDITLTNLTDGTQSTIAVTDTSQVSISGRVMTINPNPTSDLPVGKNFAVRIAATAVKDLANNAFAGIDNDTTWSFATAATDTSTPTISTFSPADSATGVAVGANLVATFGENIARGTGNITLKNLSDGTSITIPVTDTAQVSVSGAVLTINPTADLASSKNYAVQIAATAVKDLANNAFAGIVNDTTWNFATAAADTIAPTISTLSPANNATDVAVGVNLVATFSEPIDLGTGDITLKNLSDATQTTIAITDEAQVSVAGSVLTINPTTDLVAGKNYAVQIADTAIDDLVGSSYPGITNDTTWSFTTATPDTTAPALITSNPANGTSNVGISGNLTATFSESIAIGTGNITLKNLTDATQVVITLPNSQVTVAGSVLTINPAADLLMGRSYAVQIADTAIDDLAGNSFDGIFNDTTWNFTVAAVEGEVWIYDGADTTNNTWTNAGSWFGGTIANGSNSTANFNLDFTADRTITLGGNRTIGNINFTDTASSHNLTISGNTLTLDLTSGTPAVHVSQSDRSLSIGSIIAGNDGLAKNGSGSLILSAANTYTGTTTISTGTLELQTTAVTNFRSSTSIASGATFKVTGNNATQVGGTFSGLALGSALTGSPGVSITGAGTLAINGVVGFGNASGATATSVAMASGGLIDIQSGSLTNGGFQKATWNSNLADVNIASGAAFDIWDGNAVTIDALTGAGRIRNGSNNATNRVLTIGADNGSGTFSGFIGGGLTGGSNAGLNKISVTKSGSGTQTLSGANTYTGLTTVNAGTLQFAKMASLYNNVDTSWTAANINVKSGGTLALNVGGTGEFTTAKITTLLTNLAASSSATNGMNSGSNLGFDTTNASGASFTIGNVIANSTGTGGGARGLTKLGTGTLVLSVSNTYTGPTQISGGTLLITGAAQSTSAITFGGGNLGLDIATPVTATSATVNFTGQTVLVTGTPTLASHTLLTAGSITGTPTLAVPISGYTLQVVSNQLRLVAGSANPYDTWAGPGVAFDADANNDGVDNGMAWVLGAANPSENALNKLPAVTRNGANLRLTFRCLKSTKRGGVVLKVQSSSDMGVSNPWTSLEAVVPDADANVNGVVFDTTDDGDYIQVIADIPVGGTKLFARLSAVNTP